MTEAQFRHLLSLVVKRAVAEIMRRGNASELDAIQRFYASDTYRRLEDERTKLWWLSPLAIADLFEDERAGVADVG
jgi:hypothetical protein